MGKITKKYIGSKQVGSIQIELENNLSLKSKMADGLSSQDLLKLDPSNLLQMLKHPYLPGAATAPEQAARQQEVTAAQDAAIAAQADATQALSETSALRTDVDTLTGDISALQAEDQTFVKLDGSRSMTGDLSMMPSLGVHHRITGLADPVDPRDAVNKQYVDAIAEGLHVHAPVKVIINQTLESVSGGTVSYDNGASGVGATLTLSVPLTSFDGYTFQDGDRIIVNGQTDKALNGIYTVGTNGSLGSVFTRAIDYNTPTEMAGGDFVFIQDGTQFADSGWVQIDTVITVGTSPVQFVQFSGAGAYSAGDGMTLIGNEFNVKYDNTTISLNGSNELRVDPVVMTRISTLESEMDTAQSDILSLDDRLDIIEPKVSVLESEMDTAQADILSLDGRLDTLEPQVSVLESEMDQAQADILSLDGRLDTLEPKVSTLESEMDAAQSSISSLQSEDLTFVKLDGTRAMSGSLDMGNFKISNLQDPSSAQEAATKAYVDSQVSGSGLTGGQAISIVSGEVNALFDNSTITLNGSNQLEVSSTVISRITSLESEMTAAQADILSLDGRVDSLESSVSSIQTDVNVLIPQMAQAQADIISLDSRVDTLELSVATLESEMDTAQADIVSLDGRLDTLEPKVSTLESEMDAVESQIISLDGRLDTIEPKIATLESEMSQAQADIISLDGRLDVVEPKIATLESEMAQAQSDIISLDGRVDILESEMDTAQANITTLEELSEIIEASAYNSFSSIYADGQPGQLDPTSTTNPRHGWYFKNSEAGQKINWYFFDGLTQANITLGNFSAYSVMTFDEVLSPILVVFTVPTGSGDITPGFAHSRVVYNLFDGPAPSAGQKCIVYFGEEPVAHPELPRFKLLKNTVVSGGDQAPGEQVLTTSFGSDSGASVNSVQYMVESLGVESPAFRGEVELEIRPAFRQLDGSVDMISAKITNLADPTLAQDAATKAYVDSRISQGTDFETQKVTLTATDISNQYIDLDFKAILGSIIGSSDRVNVIVVLNSDSDADFQQDNSGSVTRLYFQGPSASAGASALEEGQIIYFNYVKA
jgi:peptidoglycan hydrolase CwlO-like protein